MPGTAYRIPLTKNGVNVCSFSRRTSASGRLAPFAKVPPPSMELDQRALPCTGRVPTSWVRHEQETIPTSRETLSRRTPYSAKGRATFPLRQYLGSALAAEPQARDTMPQCHVSIRRAPLGIQQVLASIRSRLWQARRPRTRLRWFEDSSICVPQKMKARGCRNAFVSDANCKGMRVGGHYYVAAGERQQTPCQCWRRSNTADVTAASFGAGCCTQSYPSTLALLSAIGKSCDSAGLNTGPADLPVLEPTKFDLVIATRTAKALGLTIPQSLRVQAELIE